jgi:hypothetical protein
MSAADPAAPAVPEESGPGGGRDRLLGHVVEYFAAHGIGNASLRQIATGVVEVLEQGEKDTLLAMTSAEVSDGRELAWRYWQHAADSVEFYGPLFFELAAHSMHLDDLDAPLRRANAAMWVDALATMWRRNGVLTEDEAAATARLNLAVGRGLLQDLLLTHDRHAVDVAMARWDWVMFRTPHPLPEVRELSAGWSA